jgi:hypothetical protein
VLVKETAADEVLLRVASAVGDTVAVPLLLAPIEKVVVGLTVPVVVRVPVRVTVGETEDVPLACGVSEADVVGVTVTVTVWVAETADD